MKADAAYKQRNLTASQYVRALFEPQENVAILVRNRSRGRTVQRIAQAEAVASPGFQSWLRGQNLGGADVYVGMNPLKDSSFSRTKSDILCIRHIYLDLDREGDRTLEAIRNSSDVPAPNFVLDTSPGKHQVVWKVSGFGQDEAESFLHRLANQFGGDLAATDSTRVLRLPGFANRKLTEEFIVQARQEIDSVYQLRDFAIDDGSLEAPRDSVPARSSNRMPSNHKSQSEHDWAYAKRSLARGDQFEEIIRRIADYRSEDKPSPESYARRTVKKARAELEQEQEQDASKSK
jgi:hypothetical protein